MIQKEPKYKVGDKVKVISNLDSDRRYKYWNRSEREEKTMDVHRDMVSKFAGKNVTISDVSSRGSYRIREDNNEYHWIDAMFENSDTPKGREVGDSVTIIGNLDDDKRYPYNPLNERDCTKYLHCTSYAMRNYSGKTTKIARVDTDGTYKLEIDDKSEWWCDSMLKKDIVEPKKEVDKLKRGDIVKVIDELEDKRYYYTDANDGRRKNFDTFSAMRRLSGKNVTIAKVDSDGTYKVEEDEGDNWWCPSMFDCKIGDAPERDEEFVLQDNFMNFSDGDYCILKPNLNFGKEYTVDGLDDDYEDEEFTLNVRLEDLKDIIFRVKDTYSSDGTLLLEIYQPEEHCWAEIEDTDDISCDDTFSFFFDKINVTNLSKLSDTLVPGDYVKVRKDIKQDVYYKIGDVVFKVSSNIFNAQRDDIIFKIDSTTMYKNKLVLYTKSSDGVWKDNGTVIFDDECHIEQFEKIAYCDTIQEPEEPEFKKDDIVRIKEDLKIYKDYTYKNVSFRTNKKLMDLQGKILKVTLVGTSPATKYDCSLQYYDEEQFKWLIVDDLVCFGALEKIPVNKEEEAKEVGMFDLKTDSRGDIIVELDSTIKVGDYVTLNRYLPYNDRARITYKDINYHDSYKRNLAKSFAEYLGQTFKLIFLYSDGDARLQSERGAEFNIPQGVLVKSSNDGESITIKLGDQIHVTTINDLRCKTKECLVAVLKKMGVEAGLENTKESLIDEIVKTSKALAADIMPVQTFEKTDYIKIKDHVKDGNCYNIRGKNVVVEDVERYRGKTLLYGDCQDDDKEIRFYCNGCIHVVYKDLFEKVQNKIILNDESEEIKMSKLGLGGMLTRMFGEVGEINDGSLALTFSGAVAVKRKDGDFVRYDVTSENIENQGSFILEGSDKFMILMPSPTVAVGDIIKHKGKFLQVLDIKDNGNLSTINFEAGTKTTVLKETNLFGMQFYTKVMSMMTGMAGTDGTTPGGFNPLMMLILNKDEEGSDSKMDMTTMMMLSGMFGGQGANGAQGAMNPMMMMMLMGDKEGGETSGSGMKDMMMMSMFMGGNSPFGNMFGQPQTATLQVAEPLQPVNTGLEALCKSQAEAITKLNDTVSGLLKKLEEKEVVTDADAVKVAAAKAKKETTK